MGLALNLLSTCCFILLGEVTRVLSHLELVPRGPSSKVGAKATPIPGMVFILSAVPSCYPTVPTPMCAFYPKASGTYPSSFPLNPAGFHCLTSQSEFRELEVSIECWSHSLFCFQGNQNVLWLWQNYLCFIVHLNGNILFHYKGRQHALFLFSFFYFWEERTIPVVCAQFSVTRLEWICPFAPPLPMR